MLCRSWALPSVIKGLCTHCGLCVEVCPNHGIHLDDDGPVFDERELCDACGSCEDVCPTGAIVTVFEIARPDCNDTSTGGQDER